MRDGGEAPAAVDAWLDMLARFHETHPPPTRTAHEQA
jgi:hypothetical protein